ncbi:MAG: hypothetical protein ACLVEX_08760 [Ruthenibacterium lactatiformans]
MKKEVIDILAGVSTTTSEHLHPEQREAFFICTAARDRSFLG